LPPNEPLVTDAVIVGAGAAGLAAAIFAGRRRTPGSIVVIDGARNPGAKILVSGGTRCNVTNRIVSERDFWGGSRPIVRRVLRSFTADDAVRFFRDLGVPLHEEADGKLFPDTHRARDVLNGLLQGVQRAGVPLLADHRAVEVERVGGAFRVVTTERVIQCQRIVLATGGQSLPKSGSDGAGLEFARRFGHSLVPTTPALVPLMLDGTSPSAFHRDVAGVSHDVELSVWVEGRVHIRLTGSLLWTHFGISGPVVLNASRHWLRAQLEGRPVRITANFCPGQTFESLDRHWSATATARPRLTALTALAAHLPASLAKAVSERLDLDLSGPLAHLTRDERRTLVRALVEWPVPITGSRGYNYAEATAGGVPLEEINAATMESRMVPGLYLIGEMLDVDGRIGGFNFQWAWSSGYLAGRALNQLPR
jgi:predicted Rossmann fold flavoprotein